MGRSFHSAPRLCFYIRLSFVGNGIVTIGNSAEVEGARIIGFRIERAESQRRRVVVQVNPYLINGVCRKRGNSELKFLPASPAGGILL